MSWVAASALGIAAIAAAVAVALHFIARSRPRPEPLPTARFVPLRTARARARAIALSDVALLALRVAAIAALGLGVAGPIAAHGRGRTARVILVDRSRAVLDVAAAAREARSVARAGDVVIAFDSAAAPLASISSLDSLDSLDLFARGDARGSLSGAYAAATRVAATTRFDADSIELVVISPFAAEEVDSATDSIRATWRGVGRAVVVQHTASTGSTGLPSLSDHDDAVDAGLALAGPVAGGADVRVVRGRLPAADSAWVRDSGGVLLHWPANDSSAIWPKRAEIDAVGAVASRTGVVVGRFPRLWAQAPPPGTRVVAHWVDGEPAAVEHALGRGCIRDVSILIDPSSDLTLREPFRRFAAALTAPCGGVRLVDYSAHARAAAVGNSSRVAAVGALQGTAAAWSPISPWFLALGALLLGVELAARRPRPERAA
jgi:hypothetical protein